MIDVTVTYVIPINISRCGEIDINIDQFFLFVFCLYFFDVFRQI